MKLLLVIIALLVGCASTPEAITPPVVEPVPVSVPIEAITFPASPRPVLAWGSKHPEWDKYLYDAVYKLDLSTVDNYCVKLNKYDCLAQFLSKMVEYESSNNPNATYKETGDLAGVISRGLLQISMASANQPAYACNIKEAKQLHEPGINLNCGTRIASYQMRKAGVMFGQEECVKDGKKKICYYGLAAYWSVMRERSGSYPKIMKYMDQF